MSKRIATTITLKEHRILTVYYSGSLGYHELHLSQCSVLHSEVSGEVVRQVVGIAARMGRTNGTDHFLQGGGVTVLLRDVLP